MRKPTKFFSNLTAYRVNGTPADCVALGAHHWEKVDFVLSGLNLGFNLGNSIWHSGTLAAAKQAALGAPRPSSEGDRAAEVHAGRPGRP